MKRSISPALVWILAVAITLCAAYFQRTTGPTYPLRETARLAGREIDVRLLRAHGGDGDLPVVLRDLSASVEGTVLWRRYPTSEEFQEIDLAREERSLTGHLPRQPPAGKIEYRVELRDGAEAISLPAEGTVIARFKGAVPPALLVPHILFMFAAMLVSNRAGIEAIRGGSRIASYTWIALLLVLLGGMIFGPIVQKYAFGAYWTGVPFGYDLTDNKTLIAFAGWIAAAVAVVRGKNPRAWVVGAALLTMIIFLVPHSLLGSELKYE
jgi:hypothetical protein